MALHKLEKLGQIVADDATRLRGEGKSYRAIAEALKQQYHVPINHMTVKNYLDSKAAKLQRYVQGNEEAKARLELEYLNTVKQMGELNKKLWKLLERLESDEDAQTLIQCAREIRAHVELQNKLLGRLTPSSTTINAEQINVVDLSLNIVKILKKLEERKYLTIHKELPQGVIV